MSVVANGCEAVLDLLAVRTGLTFPPSGRATAEQGVRRAMQRAGLHDVDRYYDLLASRALTLDGLVDELTVGETYFFREPDQFRFIREEVLPELTRRRGPGHTVRMWSAGCASGEEAYSLAMLCEEENLACRAFILATDISEAALGRAARAEYGAWSLRGPGAAVADRHLATDGLRRRVPEKIRQLVTFAKLNLTAGDASGVFGLWGMDLILCRNVLIYLGPEAVRRVAAFLFESLSEGGWLIAASTDPWLAHAAPFEVLPTKHGVFYRRPFQKPTPVASSTTRGRVNTPHSRPTFVRPSQPIPVLRDSKSRHALSADHDAVQKLRALADLDPAAAESACGDALSEHKLSFDLHHLRAVLLLGLGRQYDAARAARQALYLDPSAAATHFLLGAIYQRCGDRNAARRAYRNARDLCEALPADQIVPHSDGEDATRLAAAAEAEIARLDLEVGPPQ